MQEIQALFIKMHDSKRQAKDLRVIWRDALKNHSEYQDLMADIKVFRDKKKALEDQIKLSMSSEFEQLDQLDQQMKEDQATIADMILAAIAQGDDVKVRDQYNTIYLPIMQVKFKKSDDVVA